MLKEMHDGEDKTENNWAFETISIKKFVSQVPKILTINVCVCVCVCVYVRVYVSVCVVYTYVHRYLAATKVGVVC